MYVAPMTFVDNGFTSKKLKVAILEHHGDCLAASLSQLFFKHFWHFGHCLLPC